MNTGTASTLAYIVVHYGEIATKGSNRSFFVDSLGHSISEMCRPYVEARVTKLQGRLIVECSREDVDKTVSILSRVFGIAWYAPAEIIESDYSALLRVVSGILVEHAKTGGQSFALVVRRAEKSGPMNSVEFARKLGEDCVSLTGLSVNLDAPSVRVYVDVLKGKFLVYTSKMRGLQGLPVGVSGRVIHLLSGGVDSCLSAVLLMGRGCKPLYIHFYSAPEPEGYVAENIKPVLESLSRFEGTVRAVLVPFSVYQVYSLGKVDHLEPVFFRRFMRAVAERLCTIVGAKAVSFGDSIGQVASQTLDNIACVDYGSRYPVLRPLLTYSKAQILSLAQLYELKWVKPSEYRDCCSILSSRPQVRTPLDEVTEAWTKYDYGALTDQILEKSVLATYSYFDGLLRLEDISSLQSKVGPIRRETGTHSRF
ncbi:MAG: THUMP domain-containing protein [Thermoprotei archaeon]